MCSLVPRGLGVIQNPYFLLSKYSKQLLLVTFCYKPAEIEVSFRMHGRKDGKTDGQTDVEVEIVI